MYTGFIYCIENKVNDKKYVGKTTQHPTSRFKSHLNSYKHNTRNTLLYKAFEELGAENFFISVIEMINKDTKEELRETMLLRESELMVELNTLQDGYNMMVSRDIPHKVNEEYSQRMTDSYYTGGGREWSTSPECKAMLLEASLKAKTHPNTRAYLESQECKDKLASYSEKRSNILREKLSKRVAQYTKDGEFVKYFTSTVEAGKSMGSDGSAIAKCCQGRLKTSSGFIWRYEPM